MIRLRPRKADAIDRQVRMEILRVLAWLAGVFLPLAVLAAVVLGVWEPLIGGTIGLLVVSTVTIVLTRDH